MSRALTTLRALTPLGLAILAVALLLWGLDRDPLVYLGRVVERGLLSASGLEATIERMAPLLLLAAALLLAFRAGLWNLGVDGQLLLGATFVAGAAPAFTAALPTPLAWVLLMLLGAGVGALWGLIPAILKVRFGLTEIVSSLMTSFLGVSLSALLVRTVFDDPTTAVPRTPAVEVSERLPDLFGSGVHLGVLIGLVAVVAVHLLLGRSALGLRLRILGESPAVARHVGLRVGLLTLATFAASAALAGLAGAVEVLGVTGGMRNDWNPGWGLLVVPLVLLARLNGWASILLVALLAVLTIGGESAARKIDVPNYVTPLILGLTLIFLALGQWLERRRLAAGPGR